jgi:hypothetical protein
MHSLYTEVLSGIKRKKTNHFLDSRLSSDLWQASTQSLSSMVNTLCLRLNNKHLSDLMFVNDRLTQSVLTTFPEVNLLFPGCAESSVSGFNQVRRVIYEHKVFLRRPLGEEDCASSQVDNGACLGHT